jgi:hypothetical protein
MNKTMSFALIALTCFCFLFASNATAATTTADMPAKESSDQTRIKPAVQPPNKDSYYCPGTKYINCMPPLTPMRQKMCSKDYIDWAKAHCPGVNVVY